MLINNCDYKHYKQVNGHLFKKEYISDENFLVEELGKCPKCPEENQLRYFYISLTETVLKCCSPTCLYPFKNFIFKEMETKRRFRYVYEGNRPVSDSEQMEIDNIQQRNETKSIINESFDFDFDLIDALPKSIESQNGSSSLGHSVDLNQSYLSSNMNQLVGDVLTISDDCFNISNIIDELCNDVKKYESPETSSNQIFITPMSNFMVSKLKLKKSLEHIERKTSNKNIRQIKTYRKQNTFCWKKNEETLMNLIEAKKIGMLTPLELVGQLRKMA